MKPSARETDGYPHGKEDALMPIRKTSRMGWARWGLTLLVGLTVGCSAGVTLPTGPEAPARQAVSGGALFHVQQGDLKPGRPGTRQRQEYCRRWQCAFVARADRNWCMRGCMTTWDLE